ncbi:uncharacterized protein PODANS_2_13830 [Podospora anserina S mat+]|uniref:Podospora anserina S mat+ genomic DNA chromosome 2, supercontig 3 n=3 Tax=Podospora TaxID=5144 RepID=B2ABZ0_PODAN|nr:uncharacterized protein PODANS_2_13830 [Podospora anserina S mat+]KAK4670680.1 hypothetical protein QC763_213830 [Podospora pseudopauciseta]KAK4680525.1 hypothetical protein QC764_213830 [Podospora pseudoanserina]CAP60984.1 unnamed protein product [Podospora anserina S mat+]CDP26443.1 Putative protein of unknown function [Podospora anserina S mat+]
MNATANSSSYSTARATMFDLRSSPVPTMMHHHDRDLALQKYYLLHEQHESLRQHLDELRSPQSASFFSSPSTTTSSLSPTGIIPAPAVSSSRHQFRSSSIPTIMMKRSGSSGCLGEVAQEEAKLCDVNEGIKRVLTELLNCEAVRGDRAFRTWVQSRLMDTERELRSGRRRRSAPDA